ncbi:riboflavin synthase subunit alpha [Marinithermofilum abyssi]|uniref:Riboflavin synthase n=1 Tax=Marinithermofilum abyssi TaxID=1571185 RepID=A0A8J2VFN0_9BACL|nr:riboflavin synthase [Marinithermofilum abyssi]GGE10913.1 riboflavin synthase subunit alpha [Marinithermofilum abyssi]
MFTGLVEEVGRLRKVERQGLAMRMSISCKKVLADVKLGDSIAVNGVCLTVTTFGSDFFAVDVMPETIKKSNLGRLSPGSLVNLERAMSAGDRFGGHFVQGHVDGIGEVVSRTPHENAVLFRIRVPESLTSLMVDKGSVAVNGISLTLVSVEKNTFSVSIIPHTLEMTSLKETHPGDTVNIECDMIGKYVAKLLEKNNHANTGITKDQLMRFGFAD